MIDVFLHSAPDYVRAAALVPDLLDRIMPDPAGLNILLKPNFVALRNAELSCTHPALIAAAARSLQERGARVFVADSPAFGTAEAIAKATGLTPMLAPLHIPVRTLGRPRRLPGLPPGMRISADALDADLIVNLPKLKAHSQMRLTGAVKNLFGCVAGVRKAWLHALHGDKGTQFVEVLCCLLTGLPPVVNIMDGVEAMHVTGPIAGKKFTLGFLGGSSDAPALDTAAGLMLKVCPDEIPVWRECRRMGRAGADPASLRFPLMSPDQFCAKGFTLPGDLKPESFRPDVLARSLIKRLWLTLGSA